MGLRTRLRKKLDRWKAIFLGEPASIEEAVDAVIQRLRANHLSVLWGGRLLTIDKTAGFLEEPRFANAYAEIRGAHQYDQYGGNHTIAWWLNTLCWAARRGLRLEGDFVECGVFKGDMAWVVLNVLGHDALPQNYFLFDSFEGFSSKYSSSEDYPLSPGFLEFANKHYRVQGIHEYVAERFKPYPKVKVVKGFLPDALDRICPDRISFLHIDLNSPAAEVAVLERLFDRVSPGGAIVFDDYGWKLFEKQKIAEDEFMRARGHEILELPTGQGLVIKK